MAVHLDLINRFNLNGSGTTLDGPTRFATVLEGGKTYVDASKYLPLFGKL